MELKTPSYRSATFEYLTPPSSDERENKFEFPPCLKTDTPLSHRKLLNDTSSLPRAFNRKCKLAVFCDETTELHLPSIAEEPNDERKTRVVAGVVTPGESPKLKRNVSELCPNTEYEPAKQDCSENSFSPRKKLKFWKSNVIEESEFKENSPIKVDIDDWDNAWCANKLAPSASFVLKPPPFALTLRTLNKVDGRRKKVDILSQLADQNMFQVIKKILEYMNPLDLVSLEQVCGKWKWAIEQVVSKKDLERGKRMALTSKENIPIASVNRSVRSRNETTPRKLSVFNKVPSPKRRVLQMPDHSPATKRFLAFLEVGKTLNPAETLEKCPHCGFPARKCDDQNAICSTCERSFCVQCRCLPHPSAACSFVVFLSSPSPRKERRCDLLGSKASKKALRRLL